MFDQTLRMTSKLVAFVAVMGATANLLGFFAIPIGPTKFHLLQLPIILAGLSLGPWIGGLVGFVGAAVMAYTTLNPYLLLGNAILGFSVGAMYSHLKGMKGIPLLPQLISLLGAYIVQSPYVYVTDVFLMAMPSLLVQTVILPKLFVEDVISVLLCHPILFRVNIEKLIRQER